MFVIRKTTARAVAKYALGVIAIAAATTGAPAYPQATFPSKPIRLVLGYSPGGTSDALGRPLSDHLSRAFGQPVVVDHRPGAASTIAAEIVARATPDGHTIYLSSGATTVAPSLYPKLSYSFLRDFAQATLLAEVPFVLAMAPQVPARTLQEFVAYAKPRAREVNFASSGIGTPSHLASELFAQMAGIEVTHVPYKGSGPAMVDLFAGRVQFYFTNMLGSTPHIKAGKLRALAVTREQRWSMLPDVPTIVEAGLKDYRAGTWFGLSLPRAVPVAIVQRYHAIAQQMLQSPETKARLGDQGIDLLIGVTPEQATAFVQQDTKRWAEVVRRAGIVVN